PIGFYEVFLFYKLFYSKYWHSELLEKNLLILFNPWKRDDGVYMENSNFLNDYILNEEGRILSGTYLKKSFIPWHYSQFKPSLIPALKSFLSWLPLTFEQRADPVLMAREVASMVNNNGQDDIGVLVGKWDGKYESMRAPNGQIIKANSPKYWDGSAEILERFYRNPYHPIFGHPSRTVTNFKSGHEDLPFDLYLTQYLYLRNVKQEIQWNFHVWNEIWMRRPDLGTNKYDGWQVIDATLQVTINNISNVGPVPVKAILNADLNLKKYWEDAIFVYGEVNADIKYYDSKRYNWFIDSVNSKSDIDWKDKNTKIEIIFSPKVYVGQLLNIIVNIQNRLPIFVEYNVTVDVHSEYYHGQIAHYLLTYPLETKIPPFTKKAIKLQVKPEEYLEKLVPFNIIKSKVFVKNLNSKKFVLEEMPFTFDKPELKLTAALSSKTKSHTKIIVTAKFKNPLKISLTNCKIKIGGTRTDSITYPIKDFHPLMTKRIQIPISYENDLNREVITVSLLTKQLDKVTSQIILPTTTHVDGRKLS
ncbi:Hemocyte protein-glutamine gamma-glutamyltransferase-like protein, partial [Dinothrombium tinctorium]